MTIPIDWQDDVQVKRLFAWLTKSGVGRRFPGMPIGWYQQHQCAAYDLILELIAKAGLRPDVPRKVRAHRNHLGVVVIEAHDKWVRKWKVLGSARGLFEEADKRTRRRSP